jgi:DNA-directed RNA polymerase subunit RPC12/RpoP
MADYVRFLCRKCGQRLKAKREVVGRQAHCSKCGARFAVPDPGTLDDDPPTPSTPEASLAAAETDPAPMVLKDQTVDNYQVPPLVGPRTSRSVAPQKGCGRALGLAGMTVVVGVGFLLAAIRVFAFGN